MAYVRICFCIIGTALAIRHAWHGHLLLALAGALTAVIALAGVLWGGERRSANPLVELLAGLSLVASLGGTLNSSPASDLELQHAYADATHYLFFAEQTCRAAPYGMAERASTACMMQAPTEQVSLARELNKTLHNPSPALSILEGAHQAREEPQRNACAVAFAEVYAHCGAGFMKPRSIKRLLSEAAGSVSK